MIDVKLFRIVTGEEIIAELVSRDENTITVKKGLVVMPRAQYVGCAPWATVISKVNPEIIMDMRHVVYVAEVEENVGKKYNEMFGTKLITPESKKLIV